MSKHIRFEIVYPGGKTIAVTDTFEGIVELILTSESLKNYDPIKIKCQDDPAGRVLYFDKDLFADFHNGGTHYSELIEQTECDEVYRNWLDVTINGEEVEAGALWVQKGQALTLVDKDRFVTVNLPQAGFAKAV